jgi:DNA gyrase subunit A
MVINKSGVTIRIRVDALREMGRATQGVKIIRLKEDDSIASVAKVSRFEVQEDELLEVEEGEAKNEDIAKETPSEEDIDTNDNNTNETEENNEENNEEN